MRFSKIVNIILIVLTGCGISQNIQQTDASFSSLKIVNKSNVPIYDYIIIPIYNNSTYVKKYNTIGNVYYEQEFDTNYYELWLIAKGYKSINIINEFKKGSKSFVLDKGTLISGKVIDKNNMPINGAKVIYRHFNRSYVLDITNNIGEFMLPDILPFAKEIDVIHEKLGLKKDKCSIDDDITIILDENLVPLLPM